MKIFLPLLIILFFTARALPACSQTINVQDSMALVDLYNSTNGINWPNKTNWLTTVPVAAWYGVLTTGDRVTTLKLMQNSLKGKLPASLGNLTSLEDLNLQLNSLSGPIFSTVGNLTLLTNLSLGSNKLSGPIPASIGNLVQLTTLGLGGNKLTGEIPAALGNLTNLTVLELTNNTLTGTIPIELGNLTALKYLGLRSNGLTGQIPAELGNISALQQLDLGINQLTGPIPSTLVSLPLITLRLDQNQLTDTLPNGLGNHRYSTFSINHNRFTFEGIENISFPLITYKYVWPQADVPLHQNGAVLSVTVGGTLAYNTYKWYKNGFSFATIKGDSTFTVTSPGIYNVLVSDSAILRYTSFYLKSNAITVTTLPLSLVHFTGSINKNAVELQWQTAGEVNTQYFEVQRSGVSGEFFKAGVVNTVNLPGTNRYNFTDASPLPGINNYRLKMADKDGNFSFSRVLTVKTGAENTGMQLYPNPARETAILSFNSSLADDYTINIINLDGKILRRINITAVAGLNKITLDVSAYASGSYAISVINKSGRVQNARLIKKK